jgi:hypothetical protein
MNTRHPIIGIHTVHENLKTSKNNKSYFVFYLSGQVKHPFVKRKWKFRWFWVKKCSVRPLYTLFVPEIKAS